MSTVLKITTNNSDDPHAIPQPFSLNHCVKQLLDDYFKTMDGHPSADLYDMVLREVELPLLQSVMSYSRGNQSRCAEILGINRGTLRKKLKQYGIE